MAQQLACPICGSPTQPLDVVDFNKSCEEARGKYLSLSGIPIYYFHCGQCQFCFAPEIYGWTTQQFEERIYNQNYVLVDPDYVDVRPRGNAGGLHQLFGKSKGVIRHLDYGGGSGLLSSVLREAGWDSHSFDPFYNKDVEPKSLGTFNLITAYEVFEHVPDVNALMADLRALMQPESLLLFSTLLSDGNLKPWQRITWWYAAPRNGHISLFSKNSLVYLAGREKFGFSSFSDGFHAFWKNLPTWAKPVISIK